MRLTTIRLGALAVLALSTLCAALAVAAPAAAEVIAFPLFVAVVALLVAEPFAHRHHRRDHGR